MLGMKFVLQVGARISANRNGSDMDVLSWLKQVLDSEE